MSDPLALELQMVVRLLCGCWELNLGPLEEREVFVATESSPQTPKLFPCLTGGALSG
ncbi:hypothetical protein STEG23_004819, partial [Scotinomys teguina]